MKRLLVILLISSVALAGREERRRENRRSRVWTGSQFAFFEAFPASGAGTSGPCSTTAPTGAKGETLTFTRSSSATCTKTASGGLATTGIADGDLVVLSSGQPRVEYDSDGVLGLRVESARTNSCLRSQELSNAAWSAAGSGSAAPTVTADAATAPDGTTTAERVQVPATAGGTNYSIVGQAISVNASAWSASVYLRGNGTSGSTYLAATPDGSTFVRVLCSFVADSWTRCLLQNQTLTVAAWGFRVGTDRRDASQSDRGAQDFFAWGFQVEAGAYATSYIPTTSATVTRAAESGGATVALTPPGVATGSMSLRVQLMTTASQGLMAAEASGSFKQAIITFGGERGYVGGVSKVGPLTALTAGQRTAVLWWDASSTNLILDGTTTSGTAGTPAATDGLRFGAYDNTATTIEPGIYSRICYDTSTTRCR